MKALKVDVVTQEVTRIELDDSDLLSEMQAIVGGYIERGYTFPNGDEAYCDEEGLLKGPQNFVLVEGRPLAGNLVIVGAADSKGNFTDVRYGPLGVWPALDFVSVEELKDKLDSGEYDEMEERVL